jgi:transcriptional regulator of acetoin/glycerol metabolism
VLSRDLEKRELAGQLVSVEGNSSELDGSVIPLDELVKRAIIRTVQLTKGDRTAAAQLLGIGRTTLYRKLKEYGM